MKGSFIFIGNATALIRWGPFTIFTDPNFLRPGQLAYLGHGLASRWLLEPALRIEQLHGDHWDRVCRHGLDRSTPILTTAHASRRLPARHRFRRAIGLQHWESHSVVKQDATLAVTSLTALPAGPGAVAVAAGHGQPARAHRRRRLPGTPLPHRRHPDV